MDTPTNPLLALIRAAQTLRAAPVKDRDQAIEALVLAAEGLPCTCAELYATAPPPGYEHTLILHLSHGDTFFIDHPKVDRDCDDEAEAVCLVLCAHALSE